MPIMSFTLLAGDQMARSFSILRKPNSEEQESQRTDFEQKRKKSYNQKLQNAIKKGKPPPLYPKTPFTPAPILLYEVKLGHGDVLIMQGDMQSNYLHAIKKTPSLTDSRRLNLTVRAFQETK